MDDGPKRHGWVLALMGVSIAAQARAQLDLPPLFPVPSADVSDPATAELVSERGVLVAGNIAYLGVRFEIAPQWHIYWDGQNDSGMLPLIRLDVPDGFEVLPVQWPTPRRYSVGGGLLDFVLEGEVLAIVPIRVPAGAAGTTARITGRAEWLVCHEACVPGDADLSIEMPVVAEGSSDGRQASPGHLGLFERVRKQIPVPLPERGEELGIDVRWDGRTLVVLSTDASRLEFFPHSTCGDLPDRTSSCVGTDGTLRLELVSGEAIRGVLRIWRPEGDTRADRVAIDLAPGRVHNPSPSPLLGFRAMNDADRGLVSRAGGVSGRPGGRGG